MKKEKKKPLKELPPGCGVTSENELQTFKEDQGHLTDISMSFELSPGKCKKKKKRKHLSEQQTQNDTPTGLQLDEDDQGIRKKKKKKKKSRKEAVNHVYDTTDTGPAEQSVNTEETPRKKKKREKTEDVGDAKETVTQSNEESEETHASKKKKKKKSRNEEVNDVNEDKDQDGEQFINTEKTPSKKKKREKTKEVNAAKETGTPFKEESEGTPARKKKKSMNEEKNLEKEDKDQDGEQFLSTEETPSKKNKRKKTEEVNEIHEIQTQSKEESEKSPSRNKKKTKSSNEEVNHVNEDKAKDVRQSTHTEETPRKKKKRKMTDDMDEGKETETQSNERSEETPARKNQKSRNEEVNYENEDKDQDAEQFINTEETPRKKKKRKKTEEVEEGKETEIQTHERIEETPARKKKKKLNLTLEEVGTEMTAGIRSNNEKKAVQKHCDGLEKQHTENNLESMTQTETFIGVISQDCKVENTSTQTAECDEKKSTETDEMLLNQMKEFVPEIGSRDGSESVRKMIKYDLPRFKVFKQQGIPLNHGRFTAEENERLRKNVSDFMALTNIDCPTKLFFKNRFKEDQEEIKKLKIMYKFFERIAEGIPRSCFYVYARGRRMYDDQNHQGVFSKEELHMLNKLHALHGNNWKKISELTGRSALSLQKRFTQLANKEGRWSGKEVQRLLRAVRDRIVSQISSGSNTVMSMRVTKETLYKRLPWLKIARKVKTRSWSQCREKWMGILAMKMSHGAAQTCKKSLDVQIKLIKWMYKMDIDDIAQINWEDLTALIGNVPPDYLQRKWRKLKANHVPEWQKKCFGDVVDFLHEFTLPKLQQKLTPCHELNETQQNENEESYVLSDIFQDINENEDDDDNDEEEEEEEEEEDNKTESNEKDTH